MRYIITGKNIEVTEGLKNAIYEKIGKLEKYFKPETEVRVTFSVQKKDKHKVEVTIPIKGTVIRAEEDGYVCIYRSGRRDHRETDKEVQKQDH